MTTDSSAFVLERDWSLERVSRELGHSPRHLREQWHEIPTAYVTAGGRYWVNPQGLRQWLFERSQGGDA